MTAMTMPISDLFSVVTLSDPANRSPSWKALLGWPDRGDAHLDHHSGTDAQRNLWASRLDDAVTRSTRPVLLVAEGESCHATAWWARLSPASYVSRVAGAVLFAPRGDSDTAQKFLSPRVVLPFPSAVVDSHAQRDADEVQALAASWGSRLVETGPAPLAPPAQEPAWQQAHGLLMRLTATMIDRKLRVAETFGVRL
jgi:predicted alpha/beta hydrolase family esterase